ncbi:CoA transferase [Streptomyces sp. WZ-12]|uniref:CoA transferase n=1 Tax=Streptomyces sp. WZ-12 TaxID=3030210 RepID=UPI002381362A|nr:CoA transferase [Streptomyces sp. WZ-12]
MIELRLNDNELSPLAALLAQMGLGDAFHGDATLHGTDPVIRSPHRLGEASATAQLAIGAAVSAIWERRTGQIGDVEIDIEHALHYLHPTHFVRQSGHAIDVGAERVAANGLFACADDRYVMLEAGPPYAKLLDGYLNFFDCGNNRAALAREVARWHSEDLEEALTAAGLPCCRAFTREQWLEHPQGRLLQRTPVVEIVKIADTAPVPWTPTAASPLDGLRVLDFTHVLAGPRSARTLAEYGAEVLHISAPQYPDTMAQHLGVDVGKHCAYLDLREPAQLSRMRELAAEADVFTTTWRPDVNDRFGLTPAQLAAGSTHGIVYMSANAYGHQGPWARRPGFDQNGQVASGFAAREGAPGRPRFSPVFYLADLITGYLAAAGMMAALLRRSVEGGSYHVRLSLTRSAMWVQELGLIDEQLLAGVSEKDTHPARTVTFDTAYGAVTNLAPPLAFSNLPLPRAERLVPYGADPALWKPRTG